MSFTCVLRFELAIMRRRSKKRHLALSFVMHCSYIVLLITVFQMQHGRTVNSRYVLKSTLEDFLHELRTPSPGHLTLNKVNTYGRVWECAHRTSPWLKS